MQEHIEVEIIDISSYYKNCMGITNLDINPEIIELSFSLQSGNFIKTKPLHLSQEILFENQAELRVRIKVIPTYELYSKLLSYGPDLTVISPIHVKMEVQERLSQAIKKYL